MSRQQAEALFTAVKDWIEHNKPRCAEAIHQCDRFAIASLALAETCCDIVGYHEEDES